MSRHLFTNLPVLSTLLHYWLVGSAILIMSVGCTQNSSARTSDVPTEDYQYRNWIKSLAVSKVEEGVYGGDYASPLVEAARAKNREIYIENLAQLNRLSAPSTPALKRHVTYLKQVYRDALHAAYLDYGYVELGDFMPFSSYISKPDAHTLTVAVQTMTLPPREILKHHVERHGLNPDYHGRAPNSAEFWSSDLGQGLLGAALRDKLDGYPLPSTGKIDAKILALDTLRKYDPLLSDANQELDISLPYLIALADTVEAIDMDVQAGTLEYIGVRVPTTNCVRTGLARLRLMNSTGGFSTTPAGLWSIEKTIGVMARVDLGLHTEGWSDEQARRYLESQNVTDIKRQDSALWGVRITPFKWLSWSECPAHFKEIWRVYASFRADNFDDFETFYKMILAHMPSKTPQLKAEMLATLANGRAPSP